MPPSNNASNAMQTYQSTGDPATQRFLPQFKRSKLTEILAHALAGNSKTFVVSSLTAVPDRLSNRREERRLEAEQSGRPMSVSRSGSKLSGRSGSKDSSRKGSKGSLGCSDVVPKKRFYHIAASDRERVLDVTRALRMCATRPR